MFNEFIFLLSFDELKNVILHEVTILNLAIAYILLYVIYKALGRYIYFKPQEHASKVNRTFLTLSLIIVAIHVINGVALFLPFSQEHRWIYVLCSLIILVAPLSIVVNRIIWKYEHGHRERRGWHYDYLPISKDYYKTSIHKSTNSSRNGMSMSESWEEEGVESTADNIHSDALLNILALTVFCVILWKWASVSAVNYGYQAYIYSFTISLTISGIFLDHAVFSWIQYIQKNYKKNR